MMSYRVAVASTDGKYVNDHFGRARQFLIFEISSTGYQFIESRSNIPSCNPEQADEGGHNKTLKLLADCRAVVVARIGPGVEQVLAAQGIQAFTIPDFIEEALKHLQQIDLFH